MPVTRQIPSSDSVAVEAPDNMKPKQAILDTPRRMWLAVLLVGLAAVLRIWPLQGLDPGLFWLTFYPAVAVAAICGGFYAGLLATALSCLVVTLLWPLLIGQPSIKSWADVLGLLVFAVSCLGIAGLAEARRRAITRATSAKKEAESLALTSAGREQFFKSMLNAIPNMIGYWDKNLHFGFVNTAYLEWHGKHPETIIGTPVRDLMGEQLYELNEPYIRRALAGESQHFQRALTKADGSVGYILANYIPDINSQGEVSGIFIQASDVTELKDAQTQLELAASVFENTAEGIAVTDVHGVFLSVNPAFTAITGYTMAEAIGQTPRILRSNRHDSAFYAAMWQDMNTHGRWKGDIWNRRKDGEVYLQRMTVSMIRGSGGNAVRYVSVFSDITDVWHKDEFLKHLAFHDALTDLPNRSLLMELLHHQVITAGREQSGLALMFLDLDRFKSVNDTFGHAVGDDLLKTVAQRLLVLVRQSDTVARLGGDEFVIKLDKPASKDEIAVIAKRAIAAINAPMEFGGETIQVGASIGIAVFPVDGQTPDELIRNADTAMYAAKAAGKNTFRFYEPTMIRNIDEKQ